MATTTRAPKQQQWLPDDAAAAVVEDCPLEKKEKDLPREYGVCDDPEQFARRFPTFAGDVWFAPVRRDEQAAYGGWRWHKWGAYIGERNLGRMEYLFEADGDEGRPMIDVQYIFDLGRQREAQRVGGLRPYKCVSMRSGRVLTQNWRALWDGESAECCVM